jgi:hypothetical protein
VFDEMGDEMTTPEPKIGWWRTMWSLPRVPVGPVLVGVLIVGGGGALGYQRLDAVRHESAVDACENSNEFRSFMTGYLDSQVGVPIDQAPGFDQLEPGVKQLVLSLVPVLDAGRANRAEKAAQYKMDFPIKDCSTV